MKHESSVRYSGRDFSAQEIESIRCLLREQPSLCRAALSRRVCEELSWLRPQGGLKDMSCRVAMLKMAKDGLITLPPPRRTNGNGKRYTRRSRAAEPEQQEVVTPAGQLSELRLQLVVGRRDSHLWNEHIDRYHYLGYQPLPGAQLRYLARSEGKLLALLGFGAAAWKTAPRDRFIGWTAEQRESRLHLVVNNARFLILPWVKSRNLASRLLSMATRQLPSDWQQRYGYRPVLAETFVETARFHGTCYQAANWSYLGETKGRGKLDVDDTATLPVKSVWVFPLDKCFRQKLCG